MKAGQRRRLEWLRGSIADVVGNGGTVDPTDINRLPEQHRARARQLVAEASRLWDQGEQQRAREHARAGMRELEQQIGHRWSPPSPEKPDSELLDEIRGVGP